MNAPPINQQINVTANTSGLKQVNRELDIMKGAAISAAATMVLTGSKMAAAWAGVSSVIQDKMLGPMGQIAGLAYGWLRSIKLVTDEWGRMGAKAAGAFEMLNQQFRPLLGSLEAAKNRMAELRKFAQQTPFGMKDVAEANKILQNFTKGALATQKGMVLVGDAASVAGQDLQSVAMWVGRLYDGLQSGRPIGEAAFRLQEMGIVTGQSRAAIEKMQESGADFSQMWSVMEQELGRARGAMEGTKKTLQSLEQQLADAKEAMSAGFGEGYMSGEKAGLEAQLKMVEFITPAMEEWGTAAGTVNNIMAQVKLKTVEATTSIPGLSSVIAIAGNALTTFNTLVVALAGGTGLVKLIRMFREGAPAGTRMADAVSGLKTAAKSAGGALDELLSGNLANAKTMGQAAAQTGLAAAKLGGLRGIMLGVGAAAKTASMFVGGLLRSMLFNGPTLLVAGLAAVIGTISHFVIAHQKAQKALKDYRNETEAMAQSMENTRKNIATSQQLMEAYASVTMQLSDAYRKLGEAEAARDGGGVEAARQRIANQERELELLSKTEAATLRLSDEEHERQKQNAAGAGQRGEAARQAAIGLLPGGEQQRAQKAMLVEQIRQQQEADARLRGADAARTAVGVAGSIENASRAADTAKLQAQIADQRSLLKDAESPTNIVGNPQLAGAISAQKATEAAAARAAIAALEDQLRNANTPEFSQLNAARKTGNDIVIAEQELALVNRAKSARSDAQARSKDLSEARNSDADEKEIKDKTDAAETAQFIADAYDAAIKKAFGSTPTESEMEQREIGLSAKKAEMLRLADPSRRTEAEAGLRRMSFDEAGALARATLDRRASDSQLTDDAVAAQKAAIGFEKDRIKLAVQYQGLSKEVADQQLLALDAELARVKQVAAERSAIIGLEGSAAAISTEASAQAAAGNVAGARVLEDQAAQIEDEIIRRQTRKQVLGETSDAAQADAAANSAVANRVKLRAAQRAAAERDEKFARSNAAGALGAQRLDTAAEQALQKGQTARAAALQESAKRLQEEAQREEMVLKAMQERGLSQEEASKAIDEEIKVSRENRALDEKIRQQKEQLVKDGITTDLEASEDEARGRTTSAARKRRKQQAREDEQSFKDQGFDEKEAKQMAERNERMSRMAEVEEKHIKAVNNLGEAFRKLYSWIAEQTQLNKDRFYYKNETEALQLEAQGRDKEADDKRRAAQFEQDVESLQNELKLSPEEARRQVFERNKAEFEAQKREKIDGLNGRLEEIIAEGGGKTTGPVAEWRRERGGPLLMATRAMMAARAQGPEENFHSTSYASSLTRIGGGTSLGGSEGRTFSFEKMNERLAEIRDVLKQIRETSSEQYYVHPTGQNYRPKVRLIGPTGDSGFV